MGLGSMVAGAAIDAAAKQAEMKRLLKGRTPEQQKVIKYCFGSGGCFSKGMSDEEYESMVMAKAKSVDFKQKALDKIGVDESQVKEVEPVHFEGYYFSGENDKTKTYKIRGKDGIWRTSAYQITWLFFSSSQIYVYQYTFNMDEDGKKEATQEYFYKDVTNLSSTSESVEDYVPGKKSCTGKVSYTRTTIDTNKFMINAMGEKFSCSMSQNDYTEKVIQGMKAKLREKKG